MGYGLYRWSESSESTPSDKGGQSSMTNEMRNLGIERTQEARVEHSNDSPGQPVAAESNTMGSGTPKPQVAEVKPKDVDPQSGATLRPLDRDLLKRVSALAWISSSGYLEPESSDFDKKIIDKSMSSQGWHPYKEIQNGVYAGVLETRGANPTSFPFWIYLRAGGLNGIQPVWMRWSDDDLVGPLFNLTFDSPFSGQEIYFKALHFPSAPFVEKGIVASACLEITLIPYMETAPDLKYIESISSKAFCRKGPKELIPLGQVAFVFDHTE
jgi:hypothetical protein